MGAHLHNRGRGPPRPVVQATTISAAGQRPAAHAGLEEAQGLLQFAHHAVERTPYRQVVVAARTPSQQSASSNHLSAADVPRLVHLIRLALDADPAVQIRGHRPVEMLGFALHHLGETLSLDTALVQAASDVSAVPYVHEVVERFAGSTNVEEQWVVTKASWLLSSHFSVPPLVPSLGQDDAECKTLASRYGLSESSMSIGAAAASSASCAEQPTFTISVARASSKADVLQQGENSPASDYNSQVGSETRGIRKKPRQLRSTPLRPAARQAARVGLSR